MAHDGVSPARSAAYAVLLRAAADRRHVDVSAVTSPELASLDGHDSGLAMELASGTLRRRGSIDAVLRRCSRPPLRSVPPATLAALRLGAYQLLYLDRVPAHAAVDESVALVARRGARTRGYVNAVLRAVAAKGRELLFELGAGDDVASLGVRTSHPEWLVRLWLDELGREEALALLEADNVPPERCVRVNTLVADRERAAAQLALDGMVAAPASGFSLALIVQAGGAIERTAAYRDGAVTPQSRGSQLAGAVAAVDLQEGVRVADLCAAPGVKTSQLAAALPDAHLLAVENDAERARVLGDTLERLHAPHVEVRIIDVLELPDDMNGSFDTVLLDAPCTGLGTLAARPDLRWRRGHQDVPRMAALQKRLIRRAARLVRTGGALTYSVCTLTDAETVDVVDDLLQGGGLRLDDVGRDLPDYVHPRRGGTLLTLPSRHGTSGFFIARLVRED